MAEEKKIRKAVNFDLNDKALKVAYPKKSYKQAWADISKFMEENGFNHRQYSGYDSKSPMLEVEVDILLRKMKKSMPWLSKKDVIKEFDVTDIGETQSYKRIFTREKKKTKDLSN